MKREKIMENIEMLAMSQGFYGRLLSSLYELEESNPDMYESIMSELEAQHFGSAVEMVMFFES